ncbi:hypothetical protein Glove_543g82 [Diversispora epigaea]|uniref:BTB domain-containing protein n=1 Tax=Diversispora epigaea TaxID=1348612 RepID=A0A397GGC0_9GLOM|nr:hypothetical protein Glove_543g82 [Diversispora epigaea]
MSFKLFDKLSQDFSELLNDRKEYNVIIEVDKEENKKSFTTHSVVLRYRSPYFDKELENATTNENHIKTIIKPNISAQIFEIILKYIYSGIVNIEDMDTKTIYELMVNANELELKELSITLESYLIESKASWLRTNFVYHSLFDNSFDSNEFKGLKKFYNDIIVKHPNLIFESEDFSSLQETALISLLKRNDLKVDEIKIWDYVIKWGIGQNPTLPKNLEEWSSKNFKALKITLQQCLPLIRYFSIPGEDIWKKVKPYKKILEKQLWDDLTQYFMFPNQPVKSPILPARTRTLNSRIISTLILPSRSNSTRTTSSRDSPSKTTSTPKFPFPTIIPSKTISTPKLPFSFIINREHVAKLSSWIDRKSTIYSLENIPYEFQLILRGSRDGFHPKTFWKMCNGHAGTIVLAKVATTDEIVGGYNPLAWDNSTTGTYMKTNDSFIFSLKNGNIQNSILSRINDPSKALFYSKSDHQNSYGPYFGYTEFLMELNVSNFTQKQQCLCCHFSSCHAYKRRIRTTNERFSIVEYEVFKIIKNQKTNSKLNN